MILHAAPSRQAGWRQSATFATAMLASIHAPQAKAWGADGHRESANFAEAQLSPATRREVKRLLALEPGATLASSCHPHGDNLAHADRRQPAPAALKYLVHLVADLHQPLHAGYLDDKGGNLVQLQASGKGTNLHALWDSQLITHWPGGLPALRNAMQAADKPTTTFKPKQWAEQSCLIVASPGFYPATPKLAARYPARWQPAVAHQLAAAGWRLAAVSSSSSRSEYCINIHTSCPHPAAVLSPPNSCRMCGASSYRHVLDRDAAGQMRATALYQCSGCSVVFTDPAAWRLGEDVESTPERPVRPLTPESVSHAEHKLHVPAAPDLRTYGTVVQVNHERD